MIERALEREGSLWGRAGFYIFNFYFHETSLLGIGLWFLHKIQCVNRFCNEPISGGPGRDLMESRGLLFGFGDFGVFPKNIFVLHFWGNGVGEGFV